MQLKDQLLELTKILIGFKSISPYQEGSIDYIQKYLNKLNFTTTRLDRNDTANLVARYGTAEPIFAFVGHVDVVPPGDIRLWKHDPFILTEADGRLYGRGIADMKGAIACFMIAIKEYLDKNPSINGSIMLLITSDEETSAKDGTPVIAEYLQQHNLTLDYCLIGEPSSINQLGDVIKIGRRGSLNIHIEVKGKQGHIAHPHTCQNPIHLFTPALNELINIKWDNGTELFPPTSMQFANLNSGLGVDNVIPANLFAGLNFRYNNLHTQDELINKTKAILDKHGFKYEIKYRSSGLPFYTKPGYLSTITSDAIYKQCQIKPRLTTDGGTSDGRFLFPMSKELLELGLTNQHIHKIDESIADNELYDLTDIYSTILSKVFTN